MGEADCHNLTALVCDIAKVEIPGNFDVRNLNESLNKRLEIGKIMEHCPLIVWRRKHLAKKYGFKYVGVLPGGNGYYGRSRRAETDVERSVTYIIDDKKNKVKGLIGAAYCKQTKSGHFWSAWRGAAGGSPTWRYTRADSDHQGLSTEAICYGFGSNRILFYNSASKLYFYYDEDDGDRAFGTMYQDATVFDHNRALVRTQNDSIFLIDENGNAIKNFGMDDKAKLQQFSEGHAWLQVGGDIMLIDEAGSVQKRIDTFGFSMPRFPFHEGVCALPSVMRNHYFLLDQNGERKNVVNLNWDMPFQEGMTIQIGENQTRYFVDKAGQEAFPGRRFIDIRNFSEGLAAVMDGPDSLYYFINKEGKPAFDGYYRKIISDYRDGLACVQNIDGRYCYIDKHGKVIFYGKWEFDEELVSRFKYGVRK